MSIGAGGAALAFAAFVRNAASITQMEENVADPQNASRPVSLDGVDVLTSWLAHNATKPQHATKPETIAAAAILLHRLSLKFAVVLAWDMRNCAGALLQSSLARRHLAGQLAGKRQRRREAE
jgi:hypothetical protein